ncbi:MAG: hypothetical protein QNK38_00560, partial [Nitrospirota bacterium]|nr:hypothetical protein [Nitrospirota bacterium]MDX2419552.1 hypothetical protein [Nitrospirota bacterium]
LGKAKEMVIRSTSLPTNDARNALDILMNRNVLPSVQLMIVDPDPEVPETAEVLLNKAKELNPDKEIDAEKVWSGVRN